MESLKYLIILFKGTSRQGPGTENATKKALSFIKFPRDAKILDVGCGNGGQTLTLFKNTEAHITALDFSRELTGELKNRVKKSGFLHRLKAVKGSMARMNFNDGEFDCVWCEGAIYIIGFEKGLREWKRFIRPGGWLVVSEIAYVKNNPPRELKAYWNSAGIKVSTENKCMAAAVRNGYEVKRAFRLGKKGWLDYYAPLKKNLEAFRKKYRTKAAEETAAEMEEELKIFLKYGAYYDYIFYILKRPL